MEMKVDAAFHEELDPHSRTAVKSDAGNVVGRGFHESLLRSLLRGEQLEGTAFGVTKTRVMTASLNFEDHTDRRMPSVKPVGFSLLKLSITTRSSYSLAPQLLVSTRKKAAMLH